MRLIGTILAVLLLASPVYADTSQRCAPSRFTSAGGTQTGTVLPMRPENAPWTAWLGTQHGASATVTLTGFGPCLDNRAPTVCSRGGGFALGTLNSGTTAIAGPGPVDAVQFIQTSPCTTPTCVGGANENGACSADSACPGSTCGPCTTQASFCGVNQSGIE